MALRFLVLLLTLAGLLHVTAARVRAEAVVVPNVDRFRVVDPLFECVRIVLVQRGEKLTPAYVQGVSGSAFRSSANRLKNR